MLHEQLISFFIRCTVTSQPEKDNEDSGLTEKEPNSDIEIIENLANHDRGHQNYGKPDKDDT